MLARGAVAGGLIAGPGRVGAVWAVVADGAVRGTDVGGAGWAAGGGGTGDLNTGTDVVGAGGAVGAVATVAAVAMGGIPTGSRSLGADFGASRRTQNTPSQTLQRARMPDSGIFSGSTRKTV